MSTSKKKDKYMNECNEIFKNINTIHKVIFNDNTKRTTKYLEEYLNLCERYSEIIERINTIPNRCSMIEQKKITITMTILKFNVYELNEKIKKFDAKKPK